MTPRVDRKGIHLSDFSHDIMESPAFRATLVQLATELDRPLADVEAEAHDDLKELAREQESWAVSFWDNMCRWLAQAYQLDVDDDQIEQIKALNENSTLVFLPNHRSYLDPLILRSALAEHGFAPNHVLGGVNLSFFPLGSIARRNGTVFIRREFKNDRVYKASLKAYIAYLLEHRANLEWYIEGGRTRTGKLRPPRMGILSYLVDAFDDYATEDVTIIPVFVGYDQQYEVGAISAEELGAEKSPEGLSWMLNFIRGQSVRRGRAHLRFGEPLSLATALDEFRGDGDERNARLAVPKIAFEVMHRINKVTPIIPSALVTFALLDNDGRAITRDEGRRILEPLLEYVRQRRIDISEDLTDLSDEGGLADAVATLQREGVVKTYQDGLDPVYWIADDRQHEAGFYRNTLIHHLILRAIIEVALVASTEQPRKDPVSVIWHEANQLRDILKYEFFFPRTREYSEQIIAETQLAYPGWDKKKLVSKDLLPALQDTGLFVAHRTIAPFLEAYSVVADRLAVRPVDAEIDREQFIHECIGVATQRWRQKQLHSPESISRDLFTNALQLADNKKLLAPGDETLQAGRDRFAEIFRDAVRRVDVLRTLALREGGIK